MGVDISKVGHGYLKIHVDSCWWVQVIDEKYEAIGRLHSAVKKMTKEIKTMSTAMGYMGVYLHNNEK